ncbi:hypothetical protein [Massilia niabensis]|uniref:PEGA domain-containing protein n=1 Tax=Massilia niabensis TaxID=544910 RepID=A0ABW0LBA2_9BURK
MTSQNTTIYTPFADGRTVRDIVEHTPALVNEAWCRDLLRHTLDSLERQYATGSPHRPISPDTIVMLANNEPLLLPAAEEVGPASGQTLAADLHALALVVHYAITAELPPDGPLGPRLYDNYSTALTNGLDRCLGPNGRLRPKTAADMRALLGIDAPSSSEAIHASSVAPASAAVAPAPGPAAELPAESVAPLDESTSAPPRFVTAPAAQELAPAPDYGQPVPVPPTPEVRPAEAEPALPVAAAPVRPDTAPTDAPRLHTPSATAPLPEARTAQASVPEKRAEVPPAGSDTLLRTPAAAATDTAAAPGPTGHASPAKAPTALEAATAARLHEEASRGRTTAAPQSRASTSPGAGSVQRWGWIAGAAIVLLAAGSALVSFLQQDDARDMVNLSLPPAERAANGLEPGETVVAPRAEVANPEAGELAPVAGADPAAVAAPGAESGVPTPGANPGGLPPAASTVPGKPSDAVVNGTTYKLVIKPWGTIYVDGIDRGVSPPVKRLTLGKGLHTIQIVNPNFPDHILTVDSGSQESTTIQHDFTAKAAE